MGKNNLLYGINELNNKAMIYQKKSTTQMMDKINSFNWLSNIFMIIWKLYPTYDFT